MFPSKSRQCCLLTGAYSVSYGIFPHKWRSWMFSAVLWLLLWGQYLSAFQTSAALRYHDLKSNHDLCHVLYEELLQQVAEKWFMYCTVCQVDFVRWMKMKKRFFCNVKLLHWLPVSENWMFSSDLSSVMDLKTVNVSSHCQIIFSAFNNAMRWSFPPCYSNAIFLFR